MKATRQTDTAPERAIRSQLHGMGFRYRVNKAIPAAGGRRRADIVFTRQKVAVYVDGCFWHGCPEHGTWPKKNADFWRAKIETNQRRDADTNQKLASGGWTVVRMWEHEDPVEAAAAIADVIRNLAQDEDSAESLPKRSIVLGAKRH